MVRDDRSGHYRFGMSEASPAPQLRGATVAGRLRLGGNTLRWGLLVIWVLSLGLVTTANEQNNARLTRLQHHGIMTQVTIRSCIGNLGGSGSNAAGFTCTGTYLVDGIHEVVTVNGLVTFQAPGSKVTGVVDPSNLSYVATATSVAHDRTTSPPVVATSALGLLIAVTGFDILRRRRATQ